MNKYYTGIGSRDAPEYILDVFTKIGKYLAEKGYILRSGAAEGSDSAFEKGCDEVKGKKEIYLPWFKFNDSKSQLVVNDPRAFEIGEKYHPYWRNLNQYSRLLQARNSHQVLGRHLNSPSKFVICYTKDGKMKGGTSQAIRIAKDYNIPIFNCGKYSENELKSELSGFLKEVLKNDTLGE